jgi:alanine-synthesizing transaminase
VSSRGDTHGYSSSKGIPRLRKAICKRYKSKYNIDLDFDSEAIVTLGSKEGIAHLALAILDQGDIVMVPNPSYPIHIYGPVISGADIRYVRNTSQVDFFEELEKSIRECYPKPKLLIINFPSNPTTQCVDVKFFEKIITLAKQYKFYVVHDLAYSDIVFDGYTAPSILQVEGAKDVAVEFFTMSKSYNMAGWRIGFMVGNSKLVSALEKIKSYHDYGAFTPIQVASIIALEGDQGCVSAIRDTYKKRRDVMIQGLSDIWSIDTPKATMYLWAKIPEEFKNHKSLEFSKLLIKKAKVAASPGIGFGDYGDDFVRFALIENEERIRQAVRGIRNLFK